VTDLAERFAMSLPAVTNHLKVLKRSDLITRSLQAQFRPCHIEREPQDATLAWIEDAPRVSGTLRQAPRPSARPPVDSHDTDPSGRRRLLTKGQHE